MTCNNEIICFRCPLITAIMEYYYIIVLVQLYIDIYILIIIIVFTPRHECFIFYGL